jgi:hypothetical protein
MLGKPPYYQDADALITGLTVVKPYGEASPLTTLGITDHAPLQWIKTLAKGPVTAWRIDNLNDMDYAVAVSWYCTQVKTKFSHFWSMKVELGVAVLQHFPLLSV